MSAPLYGWAPPSGTELLITWLEDLSATVRPKRLPNDPLPMRVSTSVSSLTPRRRLPPPVAAKRSVSLATDFFQAW